jgi:DNA-binding LytR/AlgR family response regulator
MNILICDDMPEESAALNDLLKRSGYTVNTVVFDTGQAALAYIESGKKTDVCILDIVMPDMSGVELSARLRKGGFNGEIVFLSTSNEYGSESYEVKAFTYMLKPPTPESVKVLLETLMGSRENADTVSIWLKTPGIARSVRLKDIMCVEVIQHRVHFRLRDGSVLVVTTTLSEIERELLQDARFVKCHRSYIVNIDEIIEISEHEIIMRKDIRIPVARTYRDIRSKYYRRAFGGVK